MKSYTLVNPKIEGTLKTTFKANSAMEAANAAYNEMSKQFANTVPAFRFTLETEGKMQHFLVEEKLKKDTANFVITAYKGKVDEAGFKSRAKEAKKQLGGKRRHHRDEDEDSSSSDSDSPYFRKISYPIYSWWYDPLVYVDAFGPVYFPNLVGIAPNGLFAWNLGLPFVNVKKSGDPNN